MFFKPPCFPDIESLIIDGLPQNVQGQVKKVVFDFDDSGFVKGLGSGSASTARGATVYFHDEKVNPSLKLYLKCCPKDSLISSYNDLLHIFDKEITFFKVILPRMKEFCGSEELDDILPRCFGVGKVNGDLVMCLKDFSDDGFRVTGKEEFHCTDQIQTALKQLARFHGVSIAIRNATGVDFPLEYGDAVKDYVPTCDSIDEYLQKPIERHLKVCDMMIREKAAGNAALSSFIIPANIDSKLIQSLLPLATKAKKLVGLVRVPEAGEFGAISHGDFHMWNMAFRDDNKLARFFDFQEINYSSLACDIHHYLSQVTTAEFLREHQSKFLGCYTKSLEEVLKKLGIAKTFSLEDVTGEYIAKSPIAFLMGFAYVIPRFIEDQEQFLIASDATLDNKERMRALLKSGPRILKAVQISLDNLGLYQEYGAFDTMKNLLR